MQEVLKTLNNGNAALEASTLYFQTIHHWLPFISKKRIELGFALKEGPDLALFFLTMKLVVTEPNQDTDPLTVYSSAKDFSMKLQASGWVSLSCLQANVLIALFEFSHALYPAAWMTIGSCARYADLLGLGPSGDVLKLDGKIVCVVKILQITLSNTVSLILISSVLDVLG